MDLFGKLRTRAQAGEGANDGAAAHMAALEMRERPNARAGFDGDTRSKDDIGLDHRVAADHRVMREMHCLGGDERHAILKRLGPHPSLQPRFGGHELGAGVDAEGLGLVADDHARRKAAVAGEAHHIGQVVFAGGVGIADRVDQRKERGGIGGQNARIAKLDRPFRRACILELDNPLQPVAFRDKPPIAARVGGLKAQNHHVMRGAGGGKRLERFAGNERRIAIEHHDVTGKSFQSRLGLCHRMGRAELFCLLGNQNVWIPSAGGFGDCLASVSGHDNRPLRCERCPRFQGVDNQRCAPQRVENLREIGIHPRALTGRQNNKSNAHQRLKTFLAAPSSGHDEKRKVFGVHKTFRFVTPTVTEGAGNAQRDFRSRRDLGRHQPRSGGGGQCLFPGLGPWRCA